MTGINKKRFGIWIAIFVVFLLIGGGGFALNYMGYGSKGKIRQEVNDYIIKYNALSEVKTVNNDDKKSMKATLSDKGIVVTYKNDKLASKLEFIYKEEGNTKYIETIYNNRESDSETIVKYMIDAVGLKNGTAEGRIFQTYEYSDFYSSSLAQGVKLATTGNNVRVQINLYANVLANASDDGNNQGDNNSYVIITDYDKKVEDFINYTIPTQFSSSSKGYQATTANNICNIEMSVVSKETGTDALSVANLIAKGESTSAESKTINDKTWNSVSYNGAMGGKTTRLLADIKEEIIMVEFGAYYPDEECDEYFETLLSTIKEK